MNVDAFRFGTQEACLLVGATIVNQARETLNTKTFPTEKEWKSNLRTLLVIVLTGPVADAIAVSTATPNSPKLQIDVPNALKTFIAELVPGLFLLGVYYFNYRHYKKKPAKDLDAIEYGKSSLIWTGVSILGIVYFSSTIMAVKTNKVEVYGWDTLRYLIIIVIIGFTCYVSQKASD